VTAEIRQEFLTNHKPTPPTRGNHRILSANLTSATHFLIHTGHR